MGKINIDWNAALKDIRQRRIGFYDVLIIIGTFISLIFLTISDDWILALLIYKFGVVPSIYLVRALVSENAKGIEGKFNTVWDIVVSPNIETDYKFELVKGHIKTAVSKWVHYWNEFGIIVLGDATLKTKWRRLKELWKRILEGEINEGQIIWVFLYLVYTLIVTANIWEIPRPYDIIINMAFLVVLLYASSNVIGLGQFLIDVFTTLAFGEGEIESKLFELENVIRDGCQSYYFLDATHINKTPENHCRTACQTLKNNIPKLQPTNPEITQ